ncbi:hypothetical protein ABIB94_009029 [Bradyrhizobium sp. JR7.2]
MPLLMKIGQAGEQRPRQRVVDELKTTFARRNFLYHIDATLMTSNVPHHAEPVGPKFRIEPGQLGEFGDSLLQAEMPFPKSVRLLGVSLSSLQTLVNDDVEPQLDLPIWRCLWTRPIQHPDRG